MARFEILDSNAAPLGQGPADGDMLFELGMTYSVGRDMPVDLIAAHKWFNLAAMRATSTPSGCGARSPARCRMSRLRRRNAARATGCAAMPRRRRLWAPRRRWRPDR